MTDRDDVKIIVENILGTCDSISSVIEKFELWITDDIAIEMILDCNIERCPTCGWWVELFELVDSDSVPRDFCDNCEDVESFYHRTGM